MGFNLLDHRAYAESRTIYENGMSYLYSGIVNGKVVAGHYRDGFNYIRSAALSGYGLAELELGRIYRDGLIGNKVDDELAFTWFLRAANNGVAEAQKIIGQYYEENVTNPDMDSALYWYKRAANLGDWEAKESYDELRGGLGISPSVI